MAEYRAMTAEADDSGDDVVGSTRSSSNSRRMKSSNKNYSRKLGRPQFVQDAMGKCLKLILLLVLSLGVTLTIITIHGYEKN